MTSNQQMTQSRAVDFRDAGDGVFWIEICAPSGANRPHEELIGELLRVLATLREAQSLKVLVLSGLDACFLQGGRASVDAAIDQRLYAALAAFPYPVVAALRGAARGAGFLLAALCDFMVCSDAGEYGYTNAAAGLFPTAEEERLFVSRFGEPLAMQLLYAAESFSGGALRQRGFNGLTVPAGEVHAQAQRLAQGVAAKSARSLRLLKQQLSQPLIKCAQALRKGQPPAAQSLTLAAATPMASARESIRLQSEPGEVLRVTVCATSATPAESAADLCAVLEQIEHALSSHTLACRSIVLVSEHEEWLPGLESLSEPSVQEMVRKLQSALLQLPLPIVAVMGPAMPAAPWLIAQCCQAVLYLRGGRYRAAGLLEQAPLAAAAAALFTGRFGAHSGKEILLRGAQFTGVELERHGGVMAVGDAAEGLIAAQTMAQLWAAFPTATLQAWKRRQAQLQQEQIDEAADWPPCHLECEAVLPQPNPPQTGVPLALESRVIHASVHPHGIVRVRMEDRGAKNLFSDELIAGMRELITRIEHSDSYKVVILSGYENYFACGGTREALLAIQQGKAKFTDDDTYLWALRCPVPVIAALQGHAVGGGWSLGLFADFTLLSAESQYVSPYMSYGFTPGAGATLIGPYKLGHELACHTLLTAQESSGTELAERAVPLAVHPRAQLEAAALAIAQDLARHSRASLIAQKSRFNRALNRCVPQTLQRELLMHEQTFVGDARTLEQIHSNFSVTPEAAGAPRPRAAGASAAGATLLDVTATLKTLLAQELHMSEADLDEGAQFIDLGLDSITGVTWIRKVNIRYELALEATAVYSHPTLNKLARHVIEASGAMAAPAAQPGERAVRTTPPPATPPRSADLGEITADLRRLLAAELHLGEAQLDENTQFIDLGLDSITGVTWVRKINEKYRTAFEATVVYSHPTLNRLGRHLMEIAAPAPAVPAKPRERPVDQPLFGELVSWRKKPGAGIAPAAARSSAAGSPGIAVIGMAGQFPGARTLEDYWQNIAQGKNCIRAIPRERWDVDAYFQPGEPAAGKTNCRWMGLLDDYDRFDPLFFNILPAEARSMDPQQRLFLQACWQSIENAGYAASALCGSRCGVFVGCAAGDYNFLSEKVQLSAHGFTGGASSILAARISYLLNLQGPCLAIDTACSSSLVAIASACDSLISRASDLALAGGVYVGIGPAMHIMTSQAGMLSPDGRCYSFDRRANGFVPGEAVGAVLLKRLEDAERDGDIIHGVIHGWGVNQDGRTNGITAPNPDSQARLQQQVYDRYAIDPAGIQLIEAHGTGTVLGDPIEIEGLKKSFARFTSGRQTCAIGSVKSNIGHCLLAAGIAGFIKLLLALKHQQLPPTINFEKLNEHIALDDSPFFVNDQLRAWQPAGAQRRRAAISSFGYSGTNAHIVVGEHAPRVAARSAARALPARGTIVPLSARTPEQLTQRCRDLLEFIRGVGRSADLFELSFTLQVGREAMEERLALVVDSRDELALKLQAVLGAGKNVAGTFRGQVRAHKEVVSFISQDEELRALITDRSIRAAQPGRLASLWAKGVDLDWRKFHGEPQPRRLELPTYPFAKERYWIDDEDIDTTRIVNSWRATAAGQTPLHPLVHANTSDLTRFSYRSTFTGRELFFRDEGRKAHRMLPALGHLDMALEAATRTLGKLRTSRQVVQLQDVRWHRPIVIADAPLEVDIGLFAEESGALAFEVHTSRGQSDKEFLLHSQGTAHLKCARQRSVECADIRRRLREMSNEPRAQVEKLFAAEDEVLVKLSRQAGTAACGEGGLHAVLLDAALHSGVAALLARKGPYAQIDCVLAALDSIEIGPRESDVLWAWLRYAADAGSGEDLRKIDIDVFEDSGRVVIEMRGLALACRTTGLAYLMRETNKDWFWLSEHWVATELPAGRETWRDRVLAKAGHDVLVIGERDDYLTIAQLCSEADELLPMAVGSRRVEHAALESRSPPELTRHLATASEQLAVFLFLPAARPERPPGADLEMVADCLRSLTASGAPKSIQLYCCSQSAAGHSAPYQESLAGLFRSAMLDCPAHCYRGIHVADDSTSRDLLPLLAMREWLCDRAPETPAARVPMVRFLNGARCELRLSRVTPSAAVAQPAALRDGATYVVVAADHHAGELICQEWGLRYQSRFILLDRHTATHEVRALKAQGTAIHGLIQLGMFLPDTRPGASDSCQDAVASVEKVVAELDALTADQPLELYVMFASTPTLGERCAPGCAAAAAFQNGWARARHELVRQTKRRGRTLAIWCGRSAEDQNVAGDVPPAPTHPGHDFIDALSAINIMETSLQSQPEPVGFVAMFAEQETAAHASFESLTDDGEIYARIKAFENGDLSRQEFAGYLQSRQIETLSELMQQRIVQAIERFERRGLRRAELETPEAMEPPVARPREAAPPPVASASTRILVIVEKILGLTADAIDSDRPLRDYGMDSITAVRLTAALEKEFGYSIPPSSLLEHPTMNALTRKVSRDLGETQLVA